MNATPLLPAASAEVVFDGFRTAPVLDHPEGLDFDPVDGSLWCGGEAGQLFRIDLEAGTITQTHHNLGGFTLGVRFGAGRTVYWLDAFHRQLLRLRIGTGAPVEVVVDKIVGTNALTYPNALDVTADGTVYFSDSNTRSDSGASPGLYRVAPDGECSLWSAGPFDFANGVAVNPAGTAVYVAESRAQAVSRVPLLADGRSGPPERICQLTDIVPDGLAFGPDGLLYIACYYPSVILRIEHDGSVTTVYEDPIGHILSNPTNIVFRGNSLFVANLGRWHITRIDMTSALPPQLQTTRSLDGQMSGPRPH